MAKQEGKDKLQSIYNYLSEHYNQTPTDYETFKRFMHDDTYASKIHSQLVADEDVEITKDYNTFADNYGLKKKAPSATGGTGSKTGGEAKPTETVVEQPKRTYTLQEKELPIDNTRVAPPVEQLLPAQKVQREVERQNKSNDIAAKAYRVVEKLKDIRYNQNNNIPIDPTKIPSKEELEQAELNLEGTQFGTEEDKQLIRKALGDTGQNQIDDSAGRVLQGIFNIVPDAFTTYSVLQKKIDDALGGNTPIEQYQANQWAEGQRQLIKDLIPKNPYYDETTTAMIADGFGQIAPMVGIGIATGGGSLGIQALEQGAATGPRAILSAAGKELAKKALSPSSLMAGNTVFNSVFKESLETL